MSRPIVSAAALFVLLASTEAASAAEWVPRGMGNRVVGEIDWLPGDWEHVVAMGIAAQLRIDRTVFVDLDIPSVIVTPNSDENEFGETELAFGNPTVGVHWADLLSDKLAMHAGGTVTVATLVNGCDTPFQCSDSTNTRFDGVDTRAFADFNRFFPEYVFLRARTGVDLRLLPELYYRAELVSMAAIPLGKLFDTVEYFMDIHNEIEARASFGIGGGLHLQAVFNTDQSEEVTLNDTAQLAAELYVSYDPGRGFYARVGCLVALDEPLGFGLDKDNVATLRVTLGGRW
jgi:hypothetical protein